VIKIAEAEGDLMDGIEIKNMSFITFKELIHFIYTDQVFLTEENSEKLLAAAKEYHKHNNISFLITRTKFLMAIIFMWSVTFLKAH